MIKKANLSPSMTEAEFDNGYWTTVELRDFAVTIATPSACKLRKDELEKAMDAPKTYGSWSRGKDRSVRR